MSDYARKSSTMFISLALSLALSVVFLALEPSPFEAKSAFVWKYLLVDVLFFGSAFVLWLTKIYLANLDRKDGLAVRYASHQKRLLLLAAPVVSVFATPRILKEARSMAGFPPSSKTAWFWFAKLFLTCLSVSAFDSAYSRSDFAFLFLVDAALSALWMLFLLPLDARVSPLLGEVSRLQAVTGHFRGLLDSFNGGVSADDAHLRKYYGIALAEISEGNHERGIMAKAIVDSDGDPNRTKALYLKYRARNFFENQDENDKSP